MEQKKLEHEYMESFVEDIVQAMMTKFFEKLHYYSTYNMDLILENEDMKKELEKKNEQIKQLEKEWEKEFDLRTKLEEKLKTYEKKTEIIDES
jgi:predicted PilT family ATPase